MTTRASNASASDFTLASSVTREDDEHFSIDVPAGWEQGRGAFGGLVVAALTRAVTQREPDADRAVRALSLEILAPLLPGRARIRVEELKRGSGVSAFDARLLQEEGGSVVVRSRATFTLARARTTELDLEASPPEMPPYESLPIAPIGPPLGPVFTQHFEFRPTVGIPYSGSADSRVEGWVRMREHSEWGPPEWLAMVDTYWPTPIIRSSSPRPMVTLHFSAHLVEPPPPGPLYFRARASVGKDGFIDELRELFTPDGRLVVSNPQIIAIIK